MQGLEQLRHTQVYDPKQKGKLQIAKTTNKLMKQISRNSSKGFGQ
jgi:hypothetical protein